MNVTINKHLSRNNKPMTFTRQEVWKWKEHTGDCAFCPIVQPLPHKGKKVKVTLQHAMQAKPRSVAELQLYSFFNPGARLGWMIPPHAPAALSRERTRYPLYRSLGVYLCGKCRPDSGTNHGPSSPKRAFITNALSRPRMKECRSLRTVSLFVGVGSHCRPTDGSPSKQRPENPPEQLHHRGLDLYGRPWSTAIALSSWERTPGSHTTQGACCIQDAATPSSAHNAASPAQCGSHVSGRCRWTRWHSLWARRYEGSGGLQISALL